MGVEELKAKLASGEITQEQFKTELDKLLAAGTITQEIYDAALKTESNKGGLSEEDIKKLIQSETDKVRTEYAKKLKAEQDEKERLLKEKMTEEEKAKFESEKLKKDLADREAELTRREVALHTVDELRRLELPLEFRDILAGSSKEDTNARIKAFADQWNTALKAAVETRFKDNSNEPGKGKGGGGTGENPWKTETFNLTKQAQIMRDNPELAKQLAAQAGKPYYG